MENIWVTSKINTYAPTKKCALVRRQDRGEKRTKVEKHRGKDKESWVYEHSSQTKHLTAKDKNFEILATNYVNRQKQKLAEAFFIRDEMPILDKQKDSYQLKLFT